MEKYKNINECEFSNFSQNGEDGIIKLLTQKLLDNGYFFVEIGCGNGLENNSTNLVLNEWEGVVCDLPMNIRLHQRLLKIINPKKAISTIAGSIDLNNIESMFKILENKTIDFFSLDIDSYDFYIAQAFLKKNILPKIICVEYNSFLGKEALSVEYILNFYRYKFDPKRGLYFGASLKAWDFLFSKYGYQFIGVDTQGVNAFFILPEFFPSDIMKLKGLDFEYTKVFVDKYKQTGEELEKYVLDNFKSNLVKVESLIDEL